VVVDKSFAEELRLVLLSLNIDFEEMVELLLIAAGRWSVEGGVFPIFWTLLAFSDLVDYHFVRLYHQVFVVVRILD